MIVTEGNAATSNIESRQAFTIKASAKAFKLLSSNLYSDKPLAIVREIGCNALDSHFMAGKADVPFKVVLPSDMHPWFEVIDYGTGLSDDQVKNVFTTYFESTKTESNDQIGAMGLGSKSPFAYTDAFEVFARQDGVQNQYTCFLNQSGAPEIFLIEQLIDPSFENGVTIKVPVKKNDYQLFRTAALKAYKFFPIKPVVGANTVGWQWNEPVFGFNGTNFKTLVNDKTIYALMGPVAYPIDMNQLKGNAPTFVSSYQQRAGKGFVIEYKIGQLDVNAGREGLSYDKTTIANLIAGMEHIREEMAVDLQKAIDECESTYAAMIFMNKSDPHNIFKLTYKGKALNTTLHYSFRDALGNDTFTVRKKNMSYLEKLSTMRADNVVVTPHNGTRFILIDDRAKYLKKIRYSTENLSQVLFMSAPDRGTPASKTDFDTIIAKFDEHGTPWKYLSDMATDLPEREKLVKDPNAAKRDKVTYSGFYHFIGPFTSPIAVKDYKNLTDGELTNDYLYLRWGSVTKRLCINGYDFRADELSASAWKMITDAATKAGKPLVLVTDKVADIIPKNWADISTLLKAEIRQCMTKLSFEGIYGKWVMTGVDLGQATFDTLFANPKVNTVIKEFFEPLRAIKFGQPLDYTTEQFIKNTFSMSGDSTKADDNLINFKNKFEKNLLIEKLSSRTYGKWPTSEFGESLVLFSAMIAHGLIDETELKSYLK